MKKIEELKSLFENNQTAILEDFFTFLKFQTISSEPEYKQEMKKCIDWLKNYLEAMDFKTEIWQTEGHPVLYAENLNAGPNQPTLLIYNHYDVQPVDPLDLWKYPPFQPTIENGQIFARGAQDNKGQCFYTLLALKSLIKADGSLPINIKLCIEGEEECGSQSLSTLLKEKNEKLKADFLAIVDLGIRSLENPTITLGIRGIITMDVEVKGAFTDMHSGTNGGILYNPNHALVEILAKLRNQEGEILVPKFYEDVVELSDHDKSLISWDFDEQAYIDIFGAKPTGGEKKYLPLERNWIRPTLEINGISGGYSGLGFKTVIPEIAKAKISLRLVPNQDPEKTALKVKRFLENEAPEGVKVTVKILDGGGLAMHSDPQSKIVQIFKESYEKIFEKPCHFVYEGASIPIVHELKKTSEAEVVMVGFGLATDCIHAPNEHFGIDRLKIGYLVMANAILALQS